MTQVRLFIRAPKAVATAINDRFDAAFEDEGWPLALSIVDEERDVHEVSVYTDAPDDAAARMRMIMAEAAAEHEIGREDLGDIDWVAKSLEGLKPVRAGGFVVHGAHDRDAVHAGETAIEIEAGQAFGTGHHGTTAGCLDMIDAVLKRRTVTNALDLGTGSGVLAIALAKRQRRAAVLATDIDPVAVAVAKTNVRLNEVAGSVACLTAPGMTHGVIAGRAPYDLVVANILAGPLMRLAPAIARATAPGGEIILSGILDRQRRRVIAAFVAQGLACRRTLHREGWSTILLAK